MPYYLFGSRSVQEYSWLDTIETFPLGDEVWLGSYNDAELIAMKMEPQICREILFLLLAEKFRQLT
jgi:hypothetical protein